MKFQSGLINNPNHRANTESFQEISKAFFMITTKFMTSTVA